MEIVTNRPELLAPAGGREQFEAALLYGADAVYLGGQELSLRAACQGFSGEELEKAVREAHAAGVRVYYCLNAMPYDGQLADVEAVLETLPDLGPDGLILADPGVLRLAGRLCPDIPVHLSTQAHTVNRASVAFWKDAGVMRVNLARELGAGAIRDVIRACPDMEFELFVHGAMCLALSGHCLLSAWVNRRPANLGRCTQPCRFDYRGVSLSVEEGKRAGEILWHAQQGETFSGIWAPDDLCLLRWLPWFFRVGAHALKIEGRTKSGGHVAQVVDAYRTALDAQAAGQWSSSLFEDCLNELFHTASRPLSSGFFLPRRRLERPGEGFVPRPAAARLLEPLGEGSWRMQVRAPWSTEREAVVLVPGLRRPVLRPGTYTLENHRGERTDLLHPGMEGVLHCDLAELERGFYVRV